MIIALDYDRTFTADKELWRAFIHAARGRGHDVIMITWRDHSSNPEFAEVFTLVNTIWSTGRSPKEQYAENMGVKVDIWIDDNPASIIRGRI